MIVNEAEARPGPSGPPGAACERTELFLGEARSHPAPFLLVKSHSGLELALAPSGPGLPGRAFMKVCSARPGHTLVFFFKRSLLPFRRDRFSYGGVEWRDERLRPELARAGLDFLASGLDPSARPTWLRRSLPFTVPE